MTASEKDNAENDTINVLQKQLKDQKEYFESIIARMPGHVYWKSAQGIFLGCNDQQAKTLNLSSWRDVIGKSTYDMITDTLPEDVRRHQAALIDAVDREVMSSKKELIFEEPLIKPDGSEAYFISTKTPLYDDKNNVIGILGVSIDITKEKAAEKLRIEKEIAERETAHLRSFQEMIDILPVHIYWKNKNRVYLGCNLKQAQSAGYSSKEELIGKSDDTMPWAMQSEEIKKNDQYVMESQQLLTVEEVLTLVDGKKRIFLSKKSPTYDANGEVRGIFGVSIDITKEKEAERLIQEDLQKQVVLSEHIAEVVAHEVRTPLSAIQAGTTCIKEFIKTGQFDETYEMCDQIRSRLKQVENFIDTFLKNTKNVNNYKFQEYTIKSAINYAIQEYPFVDNKQHLLIKIGETCTNFSYLGEERLIVHVLFNLIKNALYFIAKAGKGHIEINTSFDEKNNYLHFKDFAFGIPKDEIDFIFDRFYTNTGVGTGIGLSYCKITMNSINGDITCRSELGTFTEFILRFPKINMEKIGDF